VWQSRASVVFSVAPIYRYPLSLGATYLLIAAFAAGSDVHAGCVYIMCTHHIYICIFVYTMPMYAYIFMCMHAHVFFMHL
jgi:hypothetical protein